jgi:predicted dehydrogenase
MLFLFAGLLPYSHAQDKLKIGIAGLTHGHVHWILGQMNESQFEVVGIAEENRELAQELANQYGFTMDMVYASLEEMVEMKHPQGITAFGSTFEHLKVVEVCAPLGIHVMVEKPLAVSLKHAEKMYALAQKHNIHLITNYETTWYATHHKAFNMIRDKNAIGKLRKIVVRDGHPGPKEIGVGKAFLDWLIDPVKNGGGAVMDFGCYGANLITWLMQGQKPLTVMALTQQFKPAIYPDVDDEATILLEYPGTQGIIQASWNWPIHRKDISIYGQTGYIYADNREKIRYRLGENQSEQMDMLSDRSAPFHNPFAYFSALINNEIKIRKTDLSSLENNMIVMEILEAAKKSARKGKKVRLN